MLKNISKVGAVLSKSEQQTLHGGGRVRGCYQQGGSTCCQHYTGFVFCDAGRCGSNGYCFWY
ncbi:hypothetical protein [Kordia sp.]|uniref:hypothetical protein n=1 Tax=Kordia sp. TaxID=1965332 RepID=UPI003D293144